MKKFKVSYKYTKHLSKVFQAEDEESAEVKGTENFWSVICDFGELEGWGRYRRL